MNDNTSPAPRKYEFPVDQDLLLIKAFPIVKLDVDEVTLSMYGVIRKDNKILLQGDYTDYLKRGRDGIKQPDGRFVFPFLAMKWIPEAERKHQEFCFVYNMYKEDDTFLGHRRCDSTFVIERAEQAQTQNSVSNENVISVKRKEPEKYEDKMQTDNNNYCVPEANQGLKTGKTKAGASYGVAMPGPKKSKIDQQISAMEIEQRDYFWLKAFYETLRTKRAEVMASFTSVADSISRALLSEPETLENAIKDVSEKGISGVKFHHRGVFLKFVGVGGNVLRHYGSYENAVKSAGNELTALRALYPIGTELGLRFPLMAVVDYCGWRFLASTELPINNSTLRYGSDDGLKTFHQDIPKVTADMDTMLAHTNLKSQEYYFGKFRGPFDIEAHVGNDGKTYVLDLARVMPPNNPTPEKFLFMMFRPEFVKNCPFELPTECQPSQGQIPQELTAAINLYYEKTIPEAALLINNRCSQYSPIAQIISLLHLKGVNLRNMGDVCLKLREDIQPVLVTEMLARCVKHQIREVMRKLDQKGLADLAQVLQHVRNTSLETLKEPILQYFNARFFSDNVDYWNNLQQQFNTRFFQRGKSTFDLNVWRNLIHCPVVFDRVCELTGIKFNKDVLERINGWAIEEVLSENDFRTKNFIGATVKTMSPILLGKSLDQDHKITVVPPEVPQDPSGQVDFDTPEQPPIPVDGMYKFQSSFNEAEVCQFEVQPTNLQGKFESLKKLLHTNVLHLRDNWTLWQNRFIVLTNTLDWPHTTLREDLENSIYPQPHMAPIDYLHNIEGILRIALGIARGLAYLHSEGMLFRQLTPENVWITRNELRTKALLFTPAMINPQIPKISREYPPDVLDERNFNSASDIFCFGVILDTLAREFARVRRQTWNNEISKHPKEEVHVLHTTMHAFDVELRQIRNVAARCMDPNPVNRPGLEEIIQKLQNIDVAITENHPLLSVFRVDINALEPKPQDTGPAISFAIYNGRKVTVKREETFSTYENLETTLRKGKIMSGLDDKNVRRFFGTAFEKREDKVIVYWVEEQCEMTLRDFLTQSSKMPEETAKRVILGIARGLAYIHQNHICLRNLNPMGIWVNENGIPKIASFEQAIPDDQHAAADAVTAEIYEKLYKAPEIATNDKEVYNLQVDIFSLGVIIWEVLTCVSQHKDPWEGLVSSDRSVAVVSLLKLHQQKKHPLLDDVPAEFRSIIERCWNYEPGKRPTAQEVLFKLEEMNNQMEQ